MVARMMRWPPWPPVHAKKFQVKLVLLRLEAPAGSPQVDDTAAGAPTVQEADAEVVAPGKKKVLTAEVRWKGPKTTLASLRRSSIKRNCTRALEEGADVSLSGLVVEWNEEFRNLCCLTSYKDNAYHPWEITFSVLDSNGAPSRKMAVIGFASLNLSDFVSAAEEKEIPLDIPLASPAGSFKSPLSLHVSLSLVEVRPAQESLAARSIVPVPLSPAPAEAYPAEPRDELSALKAGLRKVKIFSELMSSARRSSKKEDDGSEGRFSARSEDGEQSSSPPRAFDSDSPEETEDAEEEDDPTGKGKAEEEELRNIRKSFSYGTLAAANHLGGGSFYDDWVYYSGDRRSDCCGSSFPEAAASLSSSSSSKKGGSIIPWKKRKLSFRSPKSRGEPLLKKAYAEDGGDDIDHDRRQLSSSDGESSSLLVQPAGGAAAERSPDFWDEDGGRFAVGRWEEKEVASRDGRMKLRAQVFFASMDQRSEEAGGESACAALVAVIADWLLQAAGAGAMPVKSQFDGLIREGSREWRRLCEDDAFRLRFPDRHLDLDAVLQARVRSIAVAPAKSFVGFFHPDAEEAGAGGDEASFSFLSGAMSFDSIWEEVSRTAASGVYIVSWNDHFFVLKTEEKAYYIIDTLGERLHEGCAQAYILKFDHSTAISRQPPPAADNDRGGDAAEKEKEKEKEKEEEVQEEEAEAVVVCQGKECCKEYIKSFLAAIPIRELQADIKKGLMASTTPLHHRLQIEFHYAEPSPTPPAGDDLPSVASPVLPSEAPR